MISFELTGPWTLETFTDHAGDGGRGGRAEVKNLAKKSGRIARNRRNVSVMWDVDEVPSDNGKPVIDSPWAVGAG